MFTSTLSPTIQRVPEQTSHHVNERIRRDTLASLDKYKDASASKIDDRLHELATEWDIERAIEANASSLMLIGLGLGAFVNKKWFILPAVVGGFLLQHAVQGWCPPVPILRRLGFRTANEIDAERFILKMKKGDLATQRAAADLLATALH